MSTGCGPHLCVLVAPGFWPGKDCFSTWRRCRRSCPRSRGTSCSRGSRAKADMACTLCCAPRLCAGEKEFHASGRNAEKLHASRKSVCSEENLFLGRSLSYMSFASLALGRKKEGWSFSPTLVHARALFLSSVSSFCLCPDGEGSSAPEGDEVAAEGAVLVLELDNALKQLLCKSTPALILEAALWRRAGVHSHPLGRR